MRQGKLDSRTTTPSISTTSISTSADRSWTPMRRHTKPAVAFGKHATERRAPCCSCRRLINLGALLDVLTAACPRALAGCVTSSRSPGPRGGRSVGFFHFLLTFRNAHRARCGDRKCQPLQLLRGYSTLRCNVCWTITRSWSCRAMRRLWCAFRRGCRSRILHTPSATGCSCPVWRSIRLAFF